MPARNRGPQPNDHRLFGPKWRPVFRTAVHDCGWLLDRGYAEKSITQLVGNRYRLNARQRLAIQRVCASSTAVARRKRSEVDRAALQRATVQIDGFNLLILLESALAGGYVFIGRDGTWKDVASVHGTYKHVAQTEIALQLVGQYLQAAGVAKVHWYFDQPVSNSGRLKTRLRELATVHDWPWTVELVYNPDKAVAQAPGITVSSDSWVLDHSERWFNLAGAVLADRAGLQLIDLRQGDGGKGGGGDV